MTQYRTYAARVAAVALLTAGGLMACSKPATPSADLAQDLRAAGSDSASALTLTPAASGRRDVISAVERSPDARRTSAPARVQFAARETPPAPPPATSPEAQPPAPAASVAAVPSAVAPTVAKPSVGKRPTQMHPAQQPGRYKTEAEVIRNAPFPINP